MPISSRRRPKSSRPGSRPISWSIAATPTAVKKPPTNPKYWPISAIRSRASCPAPPKLEWVDPEGFERYRDIVYEWYRYQDEILGRLLASIDLDETAVGSKLVIGVRELARAIRDDMQHEELEILSKP